MSDARQPRAARSSAPTPLPVDASDVVVPIDVALEEIRAGRMVVLVDDEDRENEGDLCMAAEKVTPEAINFMARFGRGLICLPLTEEQIDRLRLGMMVPDAENSSGFGTAFTVSIEAREGVTTGHLRARPRAHDPDGDPRGRAAAGHRAARATSSRCARAPAACCAARARPRARSISRAWPASSPPA